MEFERDIAPLGTALPRAGARRLVAGRGRYTDDLVLPRMLHVAFVRSPYAHARIAGIDTGEAGAMSGVARIATGAELAALIQPWQARNESQPALRSPPQTALAIDVARWQGEPVAAVVAESRARAEDAAEAVAVDWRPLPVAVGVATPHAVHEAIADNLSFAADYETGDVEAAFAGAAHIVGAAFRFARHTGVPLETRTVLADFDPAAGRLTVHQSHQTPHQQQDNFARLLGLPEHKVRVVCPDVGGAFGIKLQLYGDEIATAALAILLGRPVKFQADRLEAFQSDIHARGHEVRARMAVDAAGRILALDVEDDFPIGPFSQFPRCTMAEGLHVIRLAGVPYRHEAQRGRLRVLFQNLNMVGHYRGVGHPVAYAVGERLADLAAARTGLDPFAFRRLNTVTEAEMPGTSASGQRLRGTSPHACLDALERAMAPATLRARQADVLRRGRRLGIGIAQFVEITSPGPEGYGPAGIRVSTQDAVALRLEPSGVARLAASITEQGQGTDAALAQIAAAGLGLDAGSVEVTTGDSALTPYGGGAWASRGMMVGGEAAWRAARRLRANVLEIAGALLQAAPASLDIVAGDVVDADGGEARMPLAEVCRIGHFRQDLLPADLQPTLDVVVPHVPRGGGGLTAGAQGALIALDAETGGIELQRHWVAHEAGTLVNPMLVAGQIRGGVVQGLGAALFEECRYDGEGQLLNPQLVDYLVPMAGEMPEIEVIHVPRAGGGGEGGDGGLGAKGVGEAGVAGASAAVLNAINDALAPLGAALHELPATPERVLRAIQRGESS